MKKIILVMCGFFFGLTLLVKAEVPAEHIEKFNTITTEVEAVIALQINTEQERETASFDVEYKMALTMAELNQLYLNEEISADDMKLYLDKYSSLWHQLYQWKITA